jgi:UDP-2,4-diacetamido-2,4,6-trideoxy-beta-L-altropyranose hydrolase
MKHLLIRADASAGIGNGHLMRCMALAQQWQATEGGVTFLTKCDSMSLRERLKDNGFELAQLPEVHPNPVDIQATLSLAGEIASSPNERKPWIVLDGYQFDSEYQSEVRAAGYPVMVIDDMAQFDKYHADILLNQNIQTETLIYNCDRNTRILLGPDYALLSRLFLKWQGFGRSFPKVADHILITMGGGDVENVTAQILEVLGSVEIRNLEVKVVVGNSNPHYESLLSCVTALNESQREIGLSVQLMRDVKDMPELMAWADVAVSGAGSTCWELAFMGVPTLMVILADNQRRVAEGLERHGVARCAGWYADLQKEKVSEQITDLIYSPDVRRQMAATGRRLVDGLGAARVVQAIATN